MVEPAPSHFYHTSLFVLFRFLSVFHPLAFNEEFYPPPPPEREREGGREGEKERESWMKFHTYVYYTYQLTSRLHYDLSSMPQSLTSAKNLSHREMENNII